MDTRLGPLSVVVCCHDGPLGLCPASRLRTAPALHRRLLWLHRPHALLLARPPQHHPHPALGDRPAGLSSVVPRELLPDGLERPASRDDVRCAPGSCLDDWLKMEADGTQRMAQTDMYRPFAANPSLPCYRSRAQIKQLSHHSPHTTHDTQQTVCRISHTCHITMPIGVLLLGLLRKSFWAFV